MESEGNDRNQTGLRTTSADQAETTVQTDIGVRNGRRRQRTSGVMRRKVAKRTCFPAMETMTHPSPPLHAEQSNADETLTGETSPVLLTDSNPIPSSQLFLPPGPPMNKHDEPASYKPPSP
jgi:hypothetical protein